MLPITIGPEIYNRPPVSRFTRLPASAVPVLQKIYDERLHESILADKFHYLLNLVGGRFEAFSFLISSRIAA
jgi:hypothetical protein